MNEFSGRIGRAMSASTAFGTVGATIGSGVVGTVSSVGGSIVGPVGTFFGYTLGASAGAVFVGSIASGIGFVFGLLSDD